MAPHSSVLAWRIPGILPGGAWWAAIYGVSQSQTQLKWLSSSSSTPLFNAASFNKKGNIGQRLWSWNSNTLATWCKELTHWKRPWCWERLKAGEEGGDRGWDGWLASPTRWIWVWVSSGSWWWTGKTGVLRSMGSQRVRHNWATELRTNPAQCHSVLVTLWS